MNQDRIVKIASAVRQAIETCPPDDLPWANFPKGACGDTCLVLGQLMLEEEIGDFVYVCGNKYRSDGIPYSHAWLQNDRWIVDITADQFPEVTQRVIVTNDSEWHRQWELERPQPGALSEYGLQGVSHLWRLHSLLKQRLQF